MSGRSRGSCALRGQQWVVGLSFAVLMHVASAHHAPTEYNFLKVVEIEGTIVEVKWQNPHVTLKVRDNRRDNPTIWEIEGSGVSMLRRTNAAAVRPRFQEKVRVAGNPSRRDPNRLYGLNLLLESGEELVFDPDGKARWKGVTVGNDGAWSDGRTESAGTGLFRVWSTKFDDPWLPGMPRDRLTKAAKEKLAAWNPVTDSVTKGCEPVGVPMLMGQPYPIEFLQQSDRIVLRIELYDLERVIHMDPKVTRGSLSPNLLGRSTGTWEDGSLVVMTDGIAWSFLDYSGVPMSAQASLVERFTPTADGKRLNYSVVITDPTYLTQPVTQERSWIARPNESVKPYDCKN